MCNSPILLHKFQRTKVKIKTTKTNVKQSKKNKLEINLKYSCYKHSLNTYFSPDSISSDMFEVALHRGTNICITKGFAINTNFRDKMNNFQIVPVNMVNANSL